jgi:hypothetical protein
LSIRLEQIAQHEVALLEFGDTGGEQGHGEQGHGTKSGSSKSLESVRSGIEHVVQIELFSSPSRAAYGCMFMNVMKRRTLRVAGING